MNFIKSFDWSARSILKALGLFVLGAAGISLALSLVGFALTLSFGQKMDRGMLDGFASRAMQGVGISPGGEYGYAPAPAASVGFFDAESSAADGLETMEEPIFPGVLSGREAEKFEIREYTGRIRTRHLARDCAQIIALKEKPEVIFEASDQSEESCYFRFKAEKDKAEPIVALIEAMDPEHLNASSQSIQGAIQDYERDLEIMRKGLNEAEITLKSSMDQYEALGDLATKKGDLQTLSRVVAEKLKLVQKLNQNRLDLEKEIDHLKWQQDSEEDRLEYVFFNLTLNKNTILDWERIEQSWKAQMKSLATNANSVFQGLTVGLAILAMRVLQGAIYLLLGIGALKGLWLGCRRLWRWGEK